MPGMDSLGSGCRMQLGKDNSSLLERAAWSCREHIGLWLGSGSNPLVLVVAVGSHSKLVLDG